MIKSILAHPATIIASMIMGGLFGYMMPGHTESLGNMGEIYLRALQMCVLPIVAIAVFTSCVSLFQREDNVLGFLTRLILLFVGGMLVVVVCGIGVGLLTSLGAELDSAQQKILSSLVQVSAEPQKRIVIEDSYDFLAMLIPHNPFVAFVEGSGLQILFLSIIMGLAFSFGKRSTVSQITELLNEVFDAFIRVMNFLVLLMPIGLFSIFAKQMSAVTPDLVHALGKLILVSVCASSFLVFLNIVAIKLHSGQSLFATCKGLGKVLVTSFATQSGFVTMPTMIKDLKDRFWVDEKLLKVVIPLGINMSPQGTCFTIALFGIFFTTMYSITLTPGVLMILMLGSMMIAMAISGMPAIVGISLIAGLFETIGIPAVVSTIVLIGVFPILDPFITVLNCIGNCGYAVVLNRADVREAAGAEAPVN